MAKIELKICIGTTCYMLGSSKLMNLETELPPAWLDRVNISASTCLNLCEANNVCNAPFITIDGDVMAHASVGKIVAELAKRLGEPIPRG